MALHIKESYNPNGKLATVGKPLPEPVVLVPSGAFENVRSSDITLVVTMTEYQGETLAFVLGNKDAKCSVMHYSLKQ